MKQIFEMKPTYLNLYDPLCQNDMPPTLYALMNSKVNFDRPAAEQTSISNLPSAFKDYLFDFNYPLDNNLKSEFETMFLKHYMFRRINFDTYLSFKLHLEVKLNDIMPKYNKMFEGFSSLDFDGLRETTVRTNQNARTISETDYETNTGTSTGSSSGSNTASSSSTNDNRFSDTPQNTIADVQNGSYVTDYTYNTGSDSSSASSSSSSSSSRSKANNKTDNDSENENITKIKLDTLEEYKKFIEYANNIYSMIFKECDSLFYGVTTL